MRKGELGLLIVGRRVVVVVCRWTCPRDPGVEKWFLAMLSRGSARLTSSPVRNGGRPACDNPNFPLPFPPFPPIQTPQTSSPPITNSKNFQNVYSVPWGLRGIDATGGRDTRSPGREEMQMPTHIFRGLVHVQTKLCPFKLPLSRCCLDPSRLYVCIASRSVLRPCCIIPPRRQRHAMQCPNQVTIYPYPKYNENLRPSPSRIHSTSTPRPPTSPSFPPSGPHL